MVDNRSLEIKQDIPLDYRLRIEGWKYAIERMPESNCKAKNCHGRGWIGRQSHTQQPLLCKCVGHWELLHEPGGGGIKDGPPK